MTDDLGKYDRPTDDSGYAPIIRIVDVVLMADAAAQAAGRDVGPADYGDPMLRTYGAGSEWADRIAQQAAVIATMVTEVDLAVRATVALCFDAWAQEMVTVASLVSAMADELAALRGSTIDDVLARPIATLTEGT